MRTEHRHVFETINIPTLIMVGELDTLTPPSMAKDIKEKIPNSLIKIVPNEEKCKTFQMDKKCKKTRE